MAYIPIPVPYYSRGSAQASAEMLCYIAQSNLLIALTLTGLVAIALVFLQFNKSLAFEGEKFGLIDAGFLLLILLVSSPLGFLGNFLWLYLIYLFINKKFKLW